MADPVFYLERGGGTPLPSYIDRKAAVCRINVIFSLNNQDDDLARGADRAMLKKIFVTAGLVAMAGLGGMSFASAQGQYVWVPQQGMGGMSGMYGMSGMRGMSGMQGMGGMRGMSGMYGMSGMRGMSGMQGMGGMSGMGGRYVWIPQQGMSGMRGMSGMQGMGGMRGMSGMYGM